MRNCGRPAEKCSVVQNGIDVTTISTGMCEQDRRVVRRMLDVPFDAPIAVMVGALDVRKGVLDFVDAARVAGRIAPSMHFAILGDGEAGEEAVRRAHQHGISARVHFLGKRADVRRILPAFDVYVQPSHYEGLALAMLEALAAGLPMVTTRVDGVADVLIDEHGALVTDVADIEGLGQHMAALAVDLREQRALSCVSQARVRECFTVDAMYRRYREVYGSMGVMV